MRVLKLTLGKIFFCNFPFLSSSACFLVGYCIISTYFVHLCIHLFSPGTFSVLVIPLSVLLTVGIFYLLGNVFEIIK
jgi:hypothetical protein